MKIENSFGKAIQNKMLLGLSMSSTYMLCNFLSKALSKDILIPKAWIVFFRFAFLFIVVCGRYAFTDPKLFKSNNLFFQIVRGISLISVTYLTYESYNLLPIYIAGSIGASEPILIGIIGVLIGYEKEFRSLLGILLLGFVSFVIVNYTSYQNISISDLTNYSKGIAYLLIANLICASSGYITRAIHKQKDSVQTTLVYSSLTSVILIPILMYFQSGHESGYFVESFSTYAARLWNVISPFKIRLFALCLLSTVSQFVYIYSLKYLDPGVHASIQNLSIFLSILYGRIFKNEFIAPITVVGSSGIFASTSALIYRRTQANQNNVLSPRNSYRITIFAIIALVVMLVLFLFLGPKSQSKSEFISTCC